MKKYRKIKKFQKRKKIQTKHYKSCQPNVAKKKLRQAKIEKKGKKIHWELKKKLEEKNINKTR